MPRGKKKQTLAETYRELGPYMGLGTELMASVLGMVLLGYFLDEHFHTSPWLLLAGALTGMVGGFYNFVRELQKLGKIGTRKKG